VSRRVSRDGIRWATRALVVAVLVAGTLTIGFLWAAILAFVVWLLCAAALRGPGTMPRPGRTEAQSLLDAEFQGLAQERDALDPW
jgi:hypothetical protein